LRTSTRLSTSCNDEGLTVRFCRAFSLLELLVSVAIISVLAGVLMPALGHARAQARRVKCSSNLRQLAHAFHMYAGDYAGRAMPLAYTRRELIGDGPAIYWWGTNGCLGVDHTRGFVWPYLASDLRVGGLYECPGQPWGTYLPQGNARGVTSTYGYNGYYLCPPHTPGWSAPGPGCIANKPWQSLDRLWQPQRLFVFADTLIDMGFGQPMNNALLDPPWLWSNGRWRQNPSPTTCFRHQVRAAVALADGHVEAFGLRGGRMTAPRYRIGSVGPDNDPHYVPDWRAW